MVATKEERINKLTADDSQVKGSKEAKEAADAKITELTTALEELKQSHKDEMKQLKDDNIRQIDIFG